MMAVSTIFSLGEHVDHVTGSLHEQPLARASVRITILGAA